MIKTKKYLLNNKIIKGNFSPYVFSVCKKITAMSCVAGLMIITNLPLVSAYEAHTVNITARIVNNVPEINPPGGDFCNDGRLEVELSVTLEEADIYYTIDGTNPACGLTTKYYIPFEIPDGIITVKAVACHEELRNGQLVVVQSAVMEEKFDASTLSVTVLKPENGDIWYCNPSNPNAYPIEWIVENYRDANELSADIVYITDNDGDGVISAGDNNFSIANNLLMGAVGSYSFVLSGDYCYYGYGWAKVTVTEASVNPHTDNCKNFGLSGRIFDPMVLDNSCEDSVSASGVIPIVPESEPEPESVISDESDVSNDNNLNPDDDSENNNSEDEEENVNEDIRDEDNEDGESEEEIIDNEEENILDEEIIIDREDDEENTDDTGSDDDNSGEEDNISNNEEDNQEDEEIIVDREDDFEENEEDNGGDSNNDEDNIDNDDVNLDTLDDSNDENSADDTTGEDDISADELPIENDDDSTEIEFNL